MHFGPGRFIVSKTVIVKHSRTTLRVFTFYILGIVQRPENKILNYCKRSPSLVRPPCWNKLDTLRLDTTSIVSCYVEWSGIWALFHTLPFICRHCRKVSV